MARVPKTIDEYLENVSDDQREALQKLRKTIRAEALRVEECISYRLAGFRLDGKMLVSFGATANHCAFYLMSSSILGSFRDQLRGYQTGKGTIRLKPDRPLPAPLVRKLVRARIEENAG